MFDDIMNGIDKTLNNETQCMHVWEMCTRLSPLRMPSKNVGNYTCIVIQPSYIYIFIPSEARSPTRGPK